MSDDNIYREEELGKNQYINVVKRTWMDTVQPIRNENSGSFDLIRYYKLIKYQANHKQLRNIFLVNMSQNTSRSQVPIYGQK